MPLCSANSSAADFEFRWRAWQVEVSARLQVTHCHLMEGFWANFGKLLWCSVNIQKHEISVMILVDMAEEDNGFSMVLL
jgi:hypothetical protein